MSGVAFPTTAVIHITESCTHKCDFCYAGKGLGLHNEANIDTLCNIVDKLNDIGVTTVCLLGGDPAKYPFVIDLLKYIKNKETIKTTLMSNTFIPDTGSFKELSQYIDIAETTLHGFDAPSHDSVCHVVGAYDNLVEKLGSSNFVVDGIL